MINNLPPNLEVCEEPYYKITMTWGPDGRIAMVTIRGRYSWKRITAIAHARHFAKRNPTATVKVTLATG